MTLNPLDLQHIMGATLKHYNEHAEAFWQGTRDHNVSQNIEALLTSIEGEPPFTILDFGCGPRPGPQRLPRIWPYRDWPRWRGALDFDGARPQRLRSLAPGIFKAGLRLVGAAPSRPVGKPIQASFIVAVNPVAQRLAVHPAKPRRVLAAEATEHHRNGQEARRLLGIRRSLGRRT